MDIAAVDELLRASEKEIEDMGAKLGGNTGVIMEPFSVSDEDQAQIEAALNDDAGGIGTKEYFDSLKSELQKKWASAPLPKVSPRGVNLEKIAVESREDYSHENTISSIERKGREEWMQTMAAAYAGRADRQENPPALVEKESHDKSKSTQAAAGEEEEKEIEKKRTRPRRSI